MASPNLSPPPLTRSRASSTTLCSPITLHSLGRRPSSFPTPDHLQSGRTTAAPVPDLQPLSSSMWDWLHSYGFQWLPLNISHKDNFSCVTPDPSPRSSTDDCSILPLSTSSQSVSFSISDHNALSPKLSSWRLHLPSLNAPILFVIFLFPISTIFILWCLSTLPISNSWPSTISDLAQLGRELHGYSQSGSGPLLHVVLVMAFSAIWKHAWSIPGSVLWNVLAGALFSPIYATILLTTLTMLGSACASLLSKPLGPFFTNLFPRALDMTRNALSGSADPDISGKSLSPKTTPAWVRLSVLRLIGVVPWSGINIACGVCDVPLADSMLGSFIGCLPWTAVTCQIGDILQTVASAPSPTPRTVQSLIATPEIVLKLVFLTVISLAPILGRSWLQTFISGPPTPRIDERRAKWRWIQEWRFKIKKSRFQEPKEDQVRLEMLIQEKRRLDDISS